MKKSLLHRVTARLRYNKLWMYFLRITGKKVQKKKWIFIVGCYNSGTTLLNQILALHPNISGLPDEGVMLTDQLARPEDFGWRRMWVNCEKEILEELMERKTDASIIKKHWSHFYDMKAEYLIEKSISNILRINFLEENFEPVFIHIVRNGYAVTEGICRKAKVMHGNPFYEEKKYPISEGAKQWVASLKMIESQKRTVNKFIEISYEKLCENPEVVINHILNELDPDLNKFNENGIRRKFKVHEKTSYVQNMNSASLNRLTPNEFEEINKVAENYLREYGYKVIQK